jgi:hypothetical protein
VAGRVPEVDAAAPVVGVERPGPGHLRVGPVGEALVEQALVDAVELLFGHEEGVVLGLDVKVRVRELNEDSRFEFGGDERPPGAGRLQAEHGGEEFG